MKVVLLFLALSALIVTSYSAPTSAEKNESAKKVIFTDGKRGADDYILAVFSTIREPTNETSQVVNWGYSRATAHISYIEISEVGPSTNAKATITSGGVGSNNLTFEAVDNNSAGFHFELMIWGTLNN